MIMCLLSLLLLPNIEGLSNPISSPQVGHVAGVMSDKCELAKEHPDQKIDKDYYHLSGTSMSAAQVSGVVALMLSQNPSLTPDEVKSRLIASAQPAVYPDGRLAFSFWQQGAGRVDANAAVFGNYPTIANQGLDIAADLAGASHFCLPAGIQACSRSPARYKWFCMERRHGLERRLRLECGLHRNCRYAWSVGYA